ncbi:hypothetical protein EAG_01007 [Camponotus floridanus]|uniref:Uncharacterized protein n=1 Tax=Camponotus floridanus TaxID=104421 RepID=E2ASN9_CAMFO|nr:hypothetical protein EAG_01007 [Camponotus floridanus]
MDDVNINEICPHVEEVEMSVDEDKWIKLNWIGKQNSDNETRQSLDVQKNENSNVQNNVDEDSNTEITETAQTSSSDSKISFINAEPEDISDGVLFPVNTTLNEIKARTAVDKKIMEHFVELLFKEDSANITNNKPSITAESFNFDPHSLDQVSQLQVSLHVLSSLALIHDKNSSLKNEINEILDIVNGTNAFHENLLLFNNTQNEYNSLALK